MATPKSPHPALLLTAAFSRHDDAINSVRTKVASAWGTICLESPRYDFSETHYYESTMGRGLKKQFFVIEGLYDPQRLPQTKLHSNVWEDEVAASGQFTESRPVNIDPGYITLTKLVLASAKDRAHRIYMAEGIYAEECLYYLDHRWQARPWTYPDYKRDDFQAFFIQARELVFALDARS